MLFSDYTLYIDVGSRLTITIKVILLMPELPEVETVCNGLRPHLEQRRIISVTLNRPNLRTEFHPKFKELVSGRKVQNLNRRGKYMILQMDQGALIMHLGMSGSFRVAGSAFETQKHDHAVFMTDQDKAIIYNDPRRFGFIDWVETENAYKPFQIMGPEPLGNAFSAPVLKTRLKGRNSPIKTALLDQSVVAGLGNIYVCEALYRAGISPLKKAQAVPLLKLERLCAAIKDVLREAIASGGSSLRDHKGVDGTMGYFQHRFDVYDQEGKTCLYCTKQLQMEKAIIRIVQAGRSTFYCPNHQK